MTRYLDPSRLTEWCVQSLERSSMPTDAAQVGAFIFVRTTMRGSRTHGIHLFPRAIERLLSGATNPVPNISVLRETVGTALLDGDNGLGQFVATRATELAIKKARRAGVAAVLVRNSNHFGAAGPFALLAAESGCIARVATNGPLALHVVGQRGPHLSTGTHAIGVPHTPPVLLDISLASSHAKITQAAARGEEIPDGWIVDAEGRPSTNPSDYLQGGARVPIGEHKGLGLALLNELVTGSLTGARSTWEIGSFLDVRDVPWGIGHSIVAIDVEAFMDREEFAVRVAETLERLGTRFPGEQAAATEAGRSASGIPIDGRLWAQLAHTAEKLDTEDKLHQSVLKRVVEEPARK
jgi:LDH2 family malate/lactate/ureidoglycolate dehydrogenase